MKTGRSKRLFGSVFTRLLMTILVTGFLINLMVIGFFGYLRHRVYDAYHNHLIQYIHYITEDLGIPPDPERAREIAQQSAMAIRYTSPTMTWATSDHFFSIAERRTHIWHESPGIVAGVVRGGYFARVQHGDGELLEAFMYDWLGADGSHSTGADGRQSGRDARPRPHVGHRHAHHPGTDRNGAGGFDAGVFAGGADVVG